MAQGEENEERRVRKHAAEDEATAGRAVMRPPEDDPQSQLPGGSEPVSPTPSVQA